MKRIFSLLLIACCLVLFTGCSKDEGRSNVSGTITLNGEPLVGGYIDFIPLDPPPGVAVVTGNATIVNGKYAIEGKLGLLPGEYKVKIMAQRRIDKKTGKDVTDEDNKEAIGTYNLVDLVPPEYGTDSEVVFKLEKKKNTVYDLDMKTK